MKQHILKSCLVILAAALLFCAVTGCRQSPGKIDSTDAAQTTAPVEISTTAQKSSAALTELNLEHMPEGYSYTDMGWAGDDFYFIFDLDKDENSDPISSANLNEIKICLYDFEQNDLTEVYSGAVLDIPVTFQYQTCSNGKTYICSERDVIVIEPGTAPQWLQMVPKTNTDQRVWVTVSPDGQRVAYTDTSTGGMVVSALDNLSEKIEVFPTSYETIWTPDSNKLIQIDNTNEQGNKLMIYDFLTNKNTEISLDLPYWGIVDPYDNNHVVCSDSGEIYKDGRKYYVKVQLDSGIKETVYLRPNTDERTHITFYVGGDCLFFAAGLEPFSPQTQLYKYDSKQQILFEDTNTFTNIDTITPHFSGDKLVIRDRTDPTDRYCLLTY